MKSITRKDDARRAEYVAELEALRATAREAVDTVNAAIEAANVAITNYNEKLSEAQGFAQDIASEIDAYADGRSEKWQESERADAYREWKEEWETFAEADQTEELEQLTDPFENDDHPDVLQNLSDSLSE